MADAHAGFSDEVGAVWDGADVVQADSFLFGWFGSQGMVGGGGSGGECCCCWWWRVIIICARMKWCREGCCLDWWTGRIIISL